MTANIKVKNHTIIYYPDDELQALRKLLKLRGVQNMRKVFTFFGLSCLAILSVAVYGQPGWNLKQNGNWAFVEFSGIDFVNSSTPFGIQTEVMQPYLINSQSSAAVSDTAGQLLFYTNGELIWDRNGNVMPNGVIGQSSSGQPDPETSSGGNVMQGQLILPVIDNPDQYYVFALNGLMDICNLWSPESHQLMYSIVDMSVNGGLGDVLSANIRLDSALGGMMTAARGEDCNIWLLVHDRDRPIFKAYEITESGVSTVPVLSNSGSFTLDWAYKWGMMQVSSNRKMLALATTFNSSAAMSIPEMGGVELFDFNASTGEVSNGRVITNWEHLLSLDSGYQDRGASVCFSPDDSRIYAPYSDDIFQYDITQPNLNAIRNSQVKIAEGLLRGVPGSPEIKLGNDGKIYTVSTGSTFNPPMETPYLGVIQDPNALGLACNFVLQGLDLAPLPDSLWVGNYWSIGNCNAFDRPFPADSIFTMTDTFICSNQDSINLQSAYSEGWEILWSDGLTSMDRVVTEPGVYWVRSSDYCHYQVDTFVVRFINVDIDLGADTSICNNYYTISSNISDVSYLWQDGTVDSYVVAKSSGIYWCEVTSAEGCVNRDSVDVRIIDLTQNLGDDTVFCKGDPIHIQLKAKLPEGGAGEITWSDQSSGPDLLINDSGLFWVAVSTIDPPCFGTDTMRVSREFCDCQLWIPSAFSPNGDGQNDRFSPVLEDPACLDLGNYTLEIFNRYGQKVFTGSILSEGWDGNINGQPADVGVYMYLISYNIGTRSEQRIQRGDVVLVR